MAPRVLLVVVVGLALFALFTDALANKRYKQMPMPSGPHSPRPDASGQNVHVVFMNHLDVGYNGHVFGTVSALIASSIPEVGFIANVINTYFDKYFPLAINVSETMAAQGGKQYIYTTHPWLVSMYLDCPIGLGFHCPNQAAVEAFENAVHKGWIVWHALPFNLQPEFMDASLFQFAISMVHDLDAKFGKAPTITMSQRDVPGMSRGVVPLLARNGVKGVTVGVNGGCAAPAVPKVFVWRDLPTHTDVIGMWHAGGYGGIGLDDCVTFPGFSEVLAYAFKSDNQGPHTLAEVAAVYAQLAREFPGANIFASTYDNYVNKVLTIKDQLPVVTGEIGDTWIYGVPSDPVKVSLYRLVARARTSCINSHRCDPNEYAMKNMSRFLVKVPEHTWGLPDDFDSGNWTNIQFAAVRNGTAWQNLEQAWYEQRLYVNHSINALPTNHPLYRDIQAFLPDLVPQYPDLSGYTRVSDLGKIFTCPRNVQFGFDGRYGSISTWIVNGVPRATPQNTLAGFVYQTLNDTDFQAMWDNYNWAGTEESSAFVKPNVTASAHPESAFWRGTMSALYESASVSCNFWIQIVMSQHLIQTYGAPREVWVQADVISNGPYNIYLTVQWFGKTATRLPEALWLTMDPPTSPSSQWYMNKLGSSINPLETILNGSQHQHGVWDGVTFSSSNASNGFVLHIVSNDAAVVSPGLATPIPATMAPLTNVDGGMSFSLFNNAWNTNYVLYYPYMESLPWDAASKFRFVLSS